MTRKRSSSVLRMWPTSIKKADEFVGFLSFQVCPIQIGLTFSALGPFGPRPSLYYTLCPSRSAS
jgi:hypothetical protein